MFFSDILMYPYVFLPLSRGKPRAALYKIFYHGKIKLWECGAFMYFKNILKDNCEFSQFYSALRRTNSALQGDSRRPEAA
jgi:hypothetical protein